MPPRQVHGYRHKGWGLIQLEGLVYAWDIVRRAKCSLSIYYLVDIGILIGGQDHHMLCLHLIVLGFVMRSRDIVQFDRSYGFKITGEVINGEVSI